MKGQKVIEELAGRFPQLYVAPADGAQEANRAAAGRGIVPDGATLDHFITSAEDELRQVDTTAGSVEVLFLKERHDFETFLQIIGRKSSPDPIARTVGAITYRGLADWGAVRQACFEYLAAGGDDWAAEFGRLARQPGMFRTELVVISEGPYSNVPAAETQYAPGEWLRISKEIRLHHECAHVVCRRTMPDDILPVWDEVTADVTGLLCATGTYDERLAGRFLGVTADGFAAGRLEEYLDDAQKDEIDEVSREVYDALGQIAREVASIDPEDPFAYLMQLKSHPLIRY